MQRNLSFRGKEKAQLAQPQMIIGRERDEKEEAESENGESHLDLMLLAFMFGSLVFIERTRSPSAIAAPTAASNPLHSRPLSRWSIFLLSPNGRSDQAAFGLRLRQGVAHLTLQ